MASQAAGAVTKLQSWENPSKPKTPSLATQASIKSARPEAAMVIWDWKGVQKARAAEAALGHARKQGIAQGIVGFIVGGVFFLFWSKLLATIVIAIAAVSMITALAFPMTHYKTLQSWIQKLGIFLGTAMTWLLLTPLYFLFFTPFGFLFRRGKNDTMLRYYDAQAPSYWQSRDTETDAKRYERSF